MTFAERAPSTSWAALKYRGEVLAEAWFKPDGDPLALVFRVPRGPTPGPDVFRRLSVDALLRAVAVAADEAESWRFGDADGDPAGPDADPKRPLPPPPPDAPHLTVTVRLKPPPQAQAVTPVEPGGADVPLEQWHALDALWQSVLGLEAGIAGSRLGVESLRAELEAACRGSLTADDKVNALQSDVAQWNRAKSRVHYTLPKLREFVHRATWATAAPERKRLEEVVRTHIEPRVPFAEADRVRAELEHLQKDRQVLAAVGTAVYQEGRGLAAEVQRALATLQRNAADRARAKRGPGRDKGKFF